MAGEYRITLPDEAFPAAELDRTRRAIELRGSITSEPSIAHPSLNKEQLNG